jgi:hypothetical protein
VRLESYDAASDTTMRRGLCARAAVVKDTTAQAVTKRFKRNFVEGFALSIVLDESTPRLVVRAKSNL